MDAPHQPPADVSTATPSAVEAEASTSFPHQQPATTGRNSSSSSRSSSDTTRYSPTIAGGDGQEEEQPQHSLWSYLPFVGSKRTKEPQDESASEKADSADLEKAAASGETCGDKGAGHLTKHRHHVRGASYLQREVSLDLSRRRSSDATAVATVVDEITSTDSPPFPSSAVSLPQTQTEDPRAIYVEWELGDPANPFNWSTRKKAITCAVCFAFTMTTDINATGYAAAQMPVTSDFGCSDLTFLLGSTTVST